jgi:asparagine synthetase B (glutamine-hydrolysing)
MCGIFCSISRQAHALPSRTVEEHLKARGPDASNLIKIEPSQQSDGSSIFVTLFSTVLSLRGSTTTAQPYHRSEAGPFLCWNGEAWRVGSESPAGNDTEAIFQLLQSSQDLASFETGHSSAEAVASLLSRVAGPYAFVYYHVQTSRLFFGRDLLGRRSLLYKIEESGDILISSITDGSSNGIWTEIEADGIYCIDLATSPTSTDATKWSGLALSKVPYFSSTSSDGSSDSIPVGDSAPGMSIRAHGR